MINKNEQLSSASIESVMIAFDQQFRLNFKDLIKETKLLTHKCQYLCYKNKEQLTEAENCARNCFKPLLYSKKNISTIIEGVKENFEKCKFNAEAKYGKDPASVRKHTQKCIKSYNEELNSKKDEVEYIYKGYMKNFDVLLSDSDKENKII
jgi:hypothetical protein